MAQQTLVLLVSTPFQRRIATHPSLRILLLSCIVGLLASVAWSTSAQAHAARTPATPDSSLASEGLLRDPECGAGFRIEGTELCTHGPDVPPLDPEIGESTPLMAGLTQPALVLCDGDGVSGKRVQLLYVREEDVPDRYTEYRLSIRRWAVEMDEIFDRSAQRTGDHRRIRFVTDADCQVQVLNVVIPAVEKNTFQSLIGALVNLGYTIGDRKYVAFVDDTVYCGIATIPRDSSPTADNKSNHRAGYARLDRGCWSGAVATHELVHNLGGVQLDAPHSSSGWHCIDEFDIMCYSDTPLYPAMQFVCPGSDEGLLDCNNDDYFHTSPPADSYLATHWNVANSAFLIVRDKANNAPPAIELSPLTATQVITAPTTITFTTQVADADGLVTKVEFYADETLLKSVTGAPYQYVWSATEIGTYTITAKVYDDLDASSTSSALDFTVVKPSPLLNSGRGNYSVVYLPVIDR
jgi:hypothetical protein